MTKLNCWEHKKCGKEPDGARTNGNPCPATTEARVDGMNSGKNGGRVCWTISGTLCGGKKQGDFGQKLEGCVACAFYKKVIIEEGINSSKNKDILARLGQ